MQQTAVQSPKPGTTRLAPSPTGALHLGNARTFLITWAIARKQRWDIVMRIEDLDGPRIKPGAADSAMDTLRWLGLDWDHGPIIQSEDLSPYTAAMRSLAARGLVYPCEMTRTEIEAAASAPQEPGGGIASESRFPSELRPPDFDKPKPFENPETNWRFIVPDKPVTLTDDFAGPQSINPSATIGDFTVWTKRAQPSYQLAVVVDDIRHNITHVIRGDDLLDSAARQTLLYRALGRAAIPKWCHLPLVVGEDGKRLAKRHGDTRVSMYRGLGVPPERLVGLIADWCGVPGPRREMNAAEFAAIFDLATMPHERIVFTAEHDTWLRAGRTKSGPTNRNPQAR